MNDRFKVRFYDKQCKMYLPDGYYINGNKWIDTYYDIVCDLPEHIIPEQCTGLNDKNGNLIYEGDIVKYSFGRKGIVSFGKYKGCYAVGWENIYVDLFGWYLDDYYEPDDCGRIRLNLDNTHDSITEEDDGDFEIIGNIHEQAEQKD